MSVDRCVCHDVTFASLLDLSKKVGASIGALSAATKCGTKCGRCVPYILLTLQTGKTRWIPQDEAGLRRLLAGADPAAWGPSAYAVPDASKAHTAAAAGPGPRGVGPVIDLPDR